VDGGGGAIGGSGTAEADLDIEQAATQAPRASVISYEGPATAQGQYDTWYAIVHADQAQVISTSWGLCELAAQSAGLVAALDPLFEAAATQGQTILAAAGDSGSEDCYTNSLTSEEVDYPASAAWVTAVGGTTLLAPGNETAWNWCQSNESIACANANGGKGAGGGGMSRYEPRPTYQPNILFWPTAESCGQYCREVPDISANAGVYMVIFANGIWTAAAGTSLAAPFIAGLVADKNNGCASLTGVWTPALYSLAAEGAYGTGFNDITAGNTDMSGSNGGAFPATTGYDAATGLGSPIAQGLSCPEVVSVTPGYSGSRVTVSGLGLEHPTIIFGTAAAQVVSADATSATVVVPAGSGTVTVQATSVLGTGTQTALFTYGTAPAPPPSPPAAPVSQHGYWLVGGDGGIFTFGSAQFHGSTGSLRLQRPVVGITPTQSHAGYWLDASDGGIFSFGDAGFYGSIPGMGLLPAGTPGNVRRLNAPVVGMVPSTDGGGYFMVASDGGVFAFGDAHFEGSCPGIGGCSGAAVAVMPDASGNGYWLVTATGHVYSFGDATFFGAPAPQGASVTSAVRTPDGGGYWILFSNGEVFPFGDAKSLGGLPAGVAGGPNPASAIYSTSDGQGFWVATASGAVYPFGDAPNDGSMAGNHLNAPIIAAVGW
jgi:Subtilase family